MTNIKVAGSVIPSKVNTPLDARSRVATVADILNIEVPAIGQLVYCLENGKFYVITALQPKLVGTVPVANMAVAEYTELITGSGSVENASDVPIVDQEGYFQASNVEEVLQEVGKGLKAKLDSDKVGRAGGVASLDAGGKVPAEQLPAATAEKAPATITLPIPSDDDLDNISLVVDFSVTGEFNNNEDGTPADYCRVTMIDHYTQMRVFANEKWELLTTTSVGLPYYFGSVSFTLDDVVFPGYKPGNKYYARYAWFDSQGAYDGWIGFSFTGDVADLRPIRLPEKDSLTVKDLGRKSGDLIIDYADGEVQNIKLAGDATLDLDNVSGVIFGKALILNIDLSSYTLIVTGDRETMTYNEYGRIYTVVISNFGKVQISVSETL